MDIYSREKRSALMFNVRTANTTPEIIVRKRLHSLGFRFRLHSKTLPGKPDIILPKHRSVIFVHGCFWHHHKNCPKSKLPTTNTEFWTEKISSNVTRDAKKTVALRRLGWRVFVIWECETKTGRFVTSLNRFLNRLTVQQIEA